MRSTRELQVRTGCTDPPPTFPLLTARRWIWLVVALVVVCAIHISSPVGYIGDVTYAAATVGAGAFALRAAARRTQRERHPWMWIAVGVTSSAVGDIWYTALDWLNDVPSDASIANFFYLGSYVSVGVGLLGLLGLRGSGRRLDVDGLIDMGSFVILSVILIGRLVDVGSIFSDNSVSTTVQLVWAAYPVMDAALLAVLVRSILSRRITGAAGLLLTVGIAGWLASDFAIILIPDLSVYSTWMNLGWMLGAAAIAAAVFHGQPAGSTATLTPSRRVGGGRVLISLVPLLVPSVIETWEYAHGVESNPVPLLVATALLIGLAVARSTRLVRARDRQEAELVRSERYYQALAENSADAVVVIDPAGRIVNDAPQLAVMLGKPGTIIAGTNAIDLIDPLDLDRVLAGWARIRSGNGVGAGELPIRHTDGTERWFAVRVVNRSDDPAIGGLIVNIHDITDRKRVEQELIQRAFSDSLTGLANRALFHDRIEHALQQTARSGTQIAVVYLDIDGFKAVNDSRGHESGDHVLREISTRLLTAVRAEDTVARLGGDEFAILIEHTSHPLEQATTVADRVLHALTAPVRFADQQIVLSASIGIAISDPTSTASSLLRDADIAMYRAKSTGKAKWAVYNLEMGATAIAHLELETDLAEALANHQFELVYQPIIQLDNEQIVGFEALLRWRHPTRGIIGPDIFIPIAEDNGSIIPIGQWVLEQACQTGATWQRQHPHRPLTMAVNLSTRQIATPDIVEHVRHALNQSGLDPHALTLEMTETALVHDPTTAAQRLHQLRNLNVKLAIDDFGTGYSSLSYLRQYPFDILKIDQSFTTTITDRDHIPAIVRGLLDLAKTLDMDIIAEGIEHTTQHQALRSHHCQYGQGFLFAQPLSPTDATTLLNQTNTQPATSHH